MQQSHTHIEEIIACYFEYVIQDFDQPEFLSNYVQQLLHSDLLKKQDENTRSTARDEFED